MRVFYGIASLLLTIAVEILLFDALYQGNTHAAWAAASFTALDLVVASRYRASGKRLGKTQSKLAVFGIKLDVVLAFVLLLGAFLANPILLGVVFWVNLAIIAVPLVPLLALPFVLLVRLARTA